MIIKHLSNNGTELDVQTFHYDYPRHITTFIDSEPIDYIGDDVLWNINERGSIDNEEEVILNDVAKCLSLDYSLYLESEKCRHIHQLINEECYVEYKRHNTLEDLLRIFNQRTITKEEKEKSILSEYKKSSYQRIYEEAGIIPIEILMEIFIEHLRDYASLNAKSFLNLIYKYYRIVKELSETYEDDECLQIQLCILRPFVTTASKPDASAFSADFSNLKFVRKIIYSLKELSMLDRSLLFNFVYALNNLPKDVNTPSMLGLISKTIPAQTNTENIIIHLNKADGSVIELNFDNSDWLSFKGEKEDYCRVKDKVIEIITEAYKEFLTIKEKAWINSVHKDATIYNKGNLLIESVWREYYYSLLNDIREARTIVKNLYDTNFCFDNILYNRCSPKYHPIEIDYAFANDLVEVLRINKCKDQEYLYRRFSEFNYIIKESFCDAHSIEHEINEDRKRGMDTVDLMMQSLNGIYNSEFIEDCDNILPYFKRIIKTILLNDKFLPLVTRNRPRTYPFNLSLLLNIIGVFLYTKPCVRYKLLGSDETKLLNKPLLKSVSAGLISSTIIQAIRKDKTYRDSNNYKSITSFTTRTYKHPSEWLLLSQTQIEIIESILKDSKYYN